MEGNDGTQKRDRWARLRFAIIGPLLAAPPAPGALQAALTALAQRPWRHPLTGQKVCFGLSTIPRWYYAARKAPDPMTVLRNQIRRDIGAFPRVSPQAAEILRAQYTDHPGWAAQLHRDNLRAVLTAGDPPRPCPSPMRQGLQKGPRFFLDSPKNADPYVNTEPRPLGPRRRFARSGHGPGRP